MNPLNWYIFYECMYGGRSEKSMNYLDFMWNVTRKNKELHTQLLKYPIILERIREQSYDKFRK